MHSKQNVTICALITTCFLAFSSAAAQTLFNSEKMERLERQTEQLQSQLNAVQEEIAEMKEQSANEDVAMLRSAAAAVVSNSPAPQSPPLPARIKLTLSGWIEAATVFRTRNQVNDMLTVFDADPYPFSPLYSELEFHGSARQTQLSLLAESKINAAQKLAGYVEIDFLGVGTSSNYIITNDWPPRLRQAYITYDNYNWGFHFLGGQAWSMVMQQKVGITPREENIPLTINANYFVGFDFTRNWELRVVKDFDKKLWLGLAIDNPAALDDPNIPNTVNGLIINFTNTGTGGFLNDVMVSPDKAPDFVEKVAWDPRRGHYELLGLQRFFTDNTFCATSAPTGCVVGTVKPKTSVGAGVGGSVLLPVSPNRLDLMGGWMYGRGIGRYGAGALPDVTIAPDGSLSPITEFHAWGGIEADSRKGLQLYSYSGIEQEQADYFDTVGYGNPASDNSGCMTPTATSFATGTSATCVGDTRRLLDFKVGFWQNIKKGPSGRFVTGIEAEHLIREGFTGIGGAPSTNNNIFFTSFRYYFDTSATEDHRPAGTQ